jgi:signal transduction histidine kinase
MHGKEGRDLVSSKSESDRDSMDSGGMEGKDRDVHVLLIEDDPEDVMLVGGSLREAFEPSCPFTLEHTAALQAGLDHLGKGDTDVLLLDLDLPDSQGLDTVVRVRERDSEVPIVVFTMHGDDDTALRVLKAGAQDFVVKSELNGSLLSRAIRYAIERQRARHESEQLQERLLQALKLESLGALAGGVAWGLERQLRLILERADIALGDLGRSSGVDSMKSTLMEIRKTTLDATQLTTGMRTYAWGGEATRGPLDLSALLVEASMFVEAMVPDNVIVSFELPGGLPRMEGDAAEIRQVLTNLVINASEAIGKELGGIFVATGSMQVDRDFLATTHSDCDLAEGEYVFLRVRNANGSIDRATMARIFDPFFTTKHAGRGLGLAATLGIVRGSGGAIKVESSPDRGTEFTLLFPALRRRRRARAATRKGASSPRSSVAGPDLSARSPRSLLLSCRTHAPTSGEVSDLEDQ